MGGLRDSISDTLVLTKRSFMRIPRAPDLLLSFTMQTMSFGGFVTALGLSKDLKRAWSTASARCRCRAPRCSPAAPSPTSAPT